MPRAFSNPIDAARMLLLSAPAWLFFIEVPRKAGGYYRLVRNSRHVTAAGLFWQAASMDLAPPEESADGNTGTTTITINDVSRTAAGAVEAEDELLGQVATLRIAHESSLDDFDPELEWEQLILAADVSGAAISLTCGHPAQFTTVPGPRLDRARFPGMLPTGG